MYTEMDGRRIIEDIKDLAEILLFPKTGKCNVKWYSSLMDSMKEIDAVSYDGNTVGNATLPKLIVSLREYLVSHRWSDAVHFIRQLLKYLPSCGPTLWKVGTELVLLDSQEDSNKIQEFHNTVRDLHDVQGLEVFLEYLLHLLERGDIETIQEALKGSNWKNRKVDDERRVNYVASLVDGYAGLTWYVLWSLEKHNMEMNTTQTDINTTIDNVALSQSIVISDGKLNSYAQKAVQYFEKLMVHDGIWDIFVTKYVEILEYQKKTEEARQILENYAAKCPENVNALKYLYKFYCDHDVDVEKVKILKAVVKLVPSDPLVLDLCPLLKKDNLSSPVPLLFSLLDYFCWQAELSPWTMLADLLELICIKGKGKPGSTDVVKHCWDVRKSWWPQYHFTAHHYHSNKENTSLNFFKGVVACVLCGKDQEFVSAARRNMSNTEKKYFKIIKRKCTDWVT